MARAVGILPATKPLVHSSSGCQKDGWSCGLWALQLMESRARAHRGEPPSAPPTLLQISHRLNEWLQKISNQYSVPVITSRKAKAKAKAKAKEEDPGPADLEEALARAMACTKCRRTQADQKGCQQCMRQYFFHVRTRKNPPPTPIPTQSLPYPTHSHPHHLQD